MDDSGASGTLAVVGTAVGPAGIGAILLGLFAAPCLVLAGTGAVLTLAAFVVLGPVAATHAVRLLGGPLDRLRGVTGALAKRNALRSPARPAATATALMTGAALVSLFTVFGASLKTTMDRTVSRSFTGDLAVGVPAFGGGGSGLSPALAPAPAELPQVGPAVGLGRGVAKIDGDGRQLTVADPAALAEGFDLGSVEGSFAGFGTKGIAVSRSQAEERSLRTGGTTRPTFTDGAVETCTVKAVYERPDPRRTGRRCVRAPRPRPGSPRRRCRRRTRTRRGRRSSSRTPGCGARRRTGRGA
ncbi:hypothetical protein SSPS47_02470 [Streptomyces sp. S4.7]|nr:hypothetical protein SSPS47_02470 [Streptomyces sp. S4.7]